MLAAVKPSKNPNCKINVQIVNNFWHFGLYALRYIEEGEELTID